MITQYLEYINESKLEFFEYSTGSTKGQVDMRVEAKQGDKVLGYADYSIDRNDQLHLKFIQNVSKQGGIGSSIIKYLADQYEYPNIYWGMLTDDGVKLKRKMDRKFNFDREKYQRDQSKQYKPEILDKIKRNYPEIANFLKVMIEKGYSSAWDEMSPNKYRSFKFDLNDVAEISEWIIGSIENNNSLDYDPPKYVNDLVKKLI